MCHEQVGKRVGGSMGDAAALGFGQVLVAAPVPLDHLHQAAIDSISGQGVELGTQVPHSVTAIDPHRRTPRGPLTDSPLSVGLAAPRGFSSAHQRLGDGRLPAADMQLASRCFGCERAAGAVKRIERALDLLRRPQQVGFVGGTHHLGVNQRNPK
ncbi:hypothetical protein [Candidatus Poriferisodalis sp.]|uniref:hypothetical protein n=1 Tax=Candidatus Poriferisodalis sp. TaxID=3101277 RepID=UPI003D14295E